MPSPSAPIPLLDLHPQNDPLRAEILAAVTRVVDSQQFILGPDVRALEEELASLFSLRHVITCSSGSDALVLALLAAGIGPGDQVAVPAFTFFATAGAVSLLGAEPVFCDIVPNTFTLDVAHLETLAPRHPRLKAVIPVHLFGGTADMDAVNGLAARHGWTVIEDSAQSIGATCRGRSCLSLGHMSTLSFFPTKNLGAMGDAGAITTADDALAERLFALRVHGSHQRYRHDWIGINGRMDSLQAAILRVKLPHLAFWATRRQANADLYRALLQETPLPVTTPVRHEFQTTHVWNQFVIRATRRDALRQHLAALGIGSEIYYPTPLHLQPCFAPLGYQQGALPECERACSEVLALPVHPGLSEADIATVVAALRAFYERSPRA
ncbi:MAG: DegT/DnrJ/EryC1/StrS family aminotransferase [Bryobacteraceae bacterium]|nr:DegT/DnrJ/EryC1/StrS family aminotransferase [Bryobacteraceae bacterium]